MCDWEEWFQSLIIKWIQIFSYTGFSVSFLTVQHAARGRLAFKQKTFSNPFWESVRPSRCVLSGLRELHITLTKYFQNKTASSRLNSFFWETVNQITINNVPTQSSIHAKAKQNKFTFKKRNWYYPFDYFFATYENELEQSISFLLRALINNLSIHWMAQPYLQPENGII